MKQSYVYILVNEYRTAFYIGETLNLKIRLQQRINGESLKFTSKYKIKDLVCF
jgi:putative endonuclease